MHQREGQIVFCSPDRQRQGITDLQDRHQGELSLKQHFKLTKIKYRKKYNQKPKQNLTIRNPNKEMLILALGDSNAAPSRLLTQNRPDFRLSIPGGYLRDLVNCTRTNIFTPGSKKLSPKIMICTFNCDLPLGKENNELPWKERNQKEFLTNMQTLWFQIKNDISMLIIVAPRPSGRASISQSRKLSEKLRENFQMAKRVKIVNPVINSTRTRDIIHPQDSEIKLLDQKLLSVIQKIDKEKLANIHTKIRKKYIKNYRTIPNRWKIKLGVVKDNRFKPKLSVDNQSRKWLEEWTKV